MRCLPSLSQYLMAPTAPFFLLTFTGIFRQCEAKKHIHFGAHYYSLSLLLKGVQLILVSIVFIPPSERRVAVAIIAVTFNQREKYFTPKWYLKHWITHTLTAQYPIFDWGRFIFHKTKEKNHFNASKKYNKLEALNSATFLASQLECIYVFFASVYPLRF